MNDRVSLASAASIFSTPPIGAEGRTDDPAFIEAAVKLAGSTQFPMFVASAARTILINEFGIDAVAALVQSVSEWDGRGALPAAVEPAACRLLVILFTGDLGVNPQRGGSPYYPWALAWQILGFTGVPGTCGGACGAWSHG